MTDCGDSEVSRKTKFPTPDLHGYYHSTIKSAPNIRMRRICCFLTDHFGKWQFFAVYSATARALSLHLCFRGSVFSEQVVSTKTQLVLRIGLAVTSHAAWRPTENLNRWGETIFISFLKIGVSPCHFVLEALISDMKEVLWALCVSPLG